MESQSAVPRPPLFPRRPNKAKPRPKPGSANELPALLTNAAGSAHPVRPGCPADHPDPASGSAGPASVGRPAARLADRLGPVAATAGPAFGSGSVGSGCSWGALLMSRLVRTRNAWWYSLVPAVRELDAGGCRGGDRGGGRSVSGQS